jgi:hypothetical protein
MRLKQASTTSVTLRILVSMGYDCILVFKIPLMIYENNSSKFSIANSRISGLSISSVMIYTCILNVV